MKNQWARWMGSMVIGVCLITPPVVAQAYTINDLNSDAIGSTFESYGINVNNYTPGVNSGSISFNLFTDYQQAGLQVGVWPTQPADLFITETYYGNNYVWAIPLVNHDTFNAGTMYAVGSSLTSTDFATLYGATVYNYNQNVPVRISSIGTNYYGYTQFGGGTVNWVALAGTPNFRVDVTTNIYQDDPNGTFSFLWGTATCANDVVAGTVPVPEPATFLLLGSGLFGLGLMRRKKAIKK